MSEIPEYKNEKEDNFFKWKGAAPPTRQSHGITEEGIDELLANNLKNHQCYWYQSGPFIVCDVGNFEHGKKIGVNQRLAGTDDNGKPLLVPIEIHREPVVKS